MKFLLLLLVLNTAQATTRYALQCPGQAELISPQRQQWLKQGHEIIIHAATLEDELKFHVERVRRFSRFHAESMLSAYRGFSDVRFYAGVTLQHDTVDVPRVIDGCATVILINEQIGDQDSWDKLPAIDKFILGMSGNGWWRADWLHFLLSERMERMTLKEFGTFRPDSWFTFAGIEGLSVCTWHDDHTPKQCESREVDVRLPSGISGKLSGDEVSFDPQGNIQTIHFQELQFPYEGKTYSSAGLVQFNADGSLNWVEGFVIEKGILRLHRGGTHRLERRLEDPYQAYIDFAGLVYNAKGQLSYGKVFDEHNGALVGFMPTGYLPLRMFVGFHGNGRFREGFVSKGAEKYFIEANSQGSIIRKMLLPYSRETQLTTISEMYHLKSDATPKQVRLYNSRGREWRSLMFKLTTTFESAPHCQVTVDEKTLVLSLPAHCESVAVVQAIIQSKERR